MAKVEEEEEEDGRVKQDGCGMWVGGSLPAGMLLVAVLRAVFAVA